MHNTQSKTRQSTVSAETSVKSSAPLIPQPHGGALSAGNPGNKGGGRPPAAFKAFLAQLRADPKAQEAFEAAAHDATSRNFSAAWKIAAEYDDDKPAEKHAIAGKVEVTVRIQREGRRLTNS
jgi:hypothetical protein